MCFCTKAGTGFHLAAELLGLFRVLESWLQGQNTQPVTGTLIRGKSVLLVSISNQPSSVPGLIFCVDPELHRSGSFGDRHVPGTTNQPPIQITNSGT